MENGSNNEAIKKALLGFIFTAVWINDEEDELVFEREDGKKFKFLHHQNCCEHVTIEDIIGEVDSLLGSPITFAEESTADATDQCPISGTWTFYKFATKKGWVDIRWLGESNGYYSEQVYFEEMN